MKINETQLAKLQELELDMLKHFIHVCEQLHLRYYLLGGTMLGAVRHQGFIPWDDDIDVGMPRKDYEIFVSQGAKYLPENLFLQTYLSDADFPANFAKIRNSDTTFIETSVRKCKINHGVYIDVFPLDFYAEPKSKWKKRLVKLKARMYSLRIGCVFTIPNQSIRIRLAKLCCLLLIPSRKRALKKREELFKSVKDTTFTANHCGAWGAKETVPTEWYGEGATLLFEGVEVTAPKEYDKWLTQVYGDYMQLPPVEKRTGHHYVDVIDMEKPYTEYGGKG